MATTDLPHTCKVCEHWKPDPDDKSESPSPCFCDERKCRTLPDYGTECPWFKASDTGIEAETRHAPDPVPAAPADEPNAEPAPAKKTVAKKQAKKWTGKKNA